MCVYNMSQKSRNTHSMSAEIRIFKCRFSTVMRNKILIEWHKFQIFFQQFKNLKS